eukprot:305667-Rhodomonas_salina.1
MVFPAHLAASSAITPRSAAPPPDDVSDFGLKDLNAKFNPVDSSVRNARAAAHAACDAGQTLLDACCCRLFGRIHACEKKKKESALARGAAPRSSCTAVI